MGSDYLIMAFQDRDAYDEELKRLQDAFLDLYSLYQQTGLSWVREELFKRACDLHMLNPDFRVEI